MQVKHFCLDIRKDRPVKNSKSSRACAERGPKNLISWDCLFQVSDVKPLSSEHTAELLYKL